MTRAPADDEKADSGKASLTDGGTAPPSPVPSPPLLQALPSLKGIVESLLFVSPEPVGMEQLQRVLEVERATLDSVLLELAADLRGRGLRLQRHAGTVQLVTAPEFAPWVEKLLGQQDGGRLSGAALEALAIVAYRQPITRAGIEAVRGVNSDRAVSTLLARGLIEEVGQMETPGHPALLGATTLFLQHFGLERLEDLPPLEESSERQVTSDKTQGTEAGAQGARH